MIDSIKNTYLKSWIREVVELCQPLRVHMCDGSQEEAHQLAQELVKKGTLIALNPTKKTQLLPRTFTS